MQAPANRNAWSKQPIMVARASACIFRLCNARIACNASACIACICMETIIQISIILRCLTLLSLTFELIIPSANDCSRFLLPFSEAFLNAIVPAGAIPLHGSVIIFAPSGNSPIKNHEDRPRVSSPPRGLNRKGGQTGESGISISLLIYYTAIYIQLEN